MQRTACVHVPHFVAELERRQRDTEMRPLIVYEGEQASGRVLGVCARGAALGVREGELLSRALAHCPDACVIPAAPQRYQEAWETLVDLLGAFSPRVEPERWGLAYLDAAGMGRLYGGEEAWCEALRHQARQELGIKVQLGVATSKFGAWVAARSSQCGPGYKVVTGSERAFLSAYPLDWLPLGPEPLRRLGLLGIRTIGQFAELPATSVAEQLGPESLAAHQLARARDPRPVMGRRQQVVEEHVEFEVPELRLEPLRAALEAASRAALADLQRRGLAIRRVELEARFASGPTAQRSAWLGEAPGPQRLRALLEQLLGALPPEGHGVVEAWLRLIGLEPWIGRQLDLFAHAQGRLKMEATLRKLAHKHAAGCVVQARLLAPSTPLACQRYGLREFQP